MDKTKDIVELEKKIIAYRNTLDDLVQKLLILEQNREKLILSIDSIKEYLQIYEIDYSNYRKINKKINITVIGIAKINTSNMTTPEAIKATLEKKGTAMHVKDITNSVLEGGKTINSKKPQNVIYATLAKRKKLFKRVGPNIYDLVKES